MPPYIEIQTSNKYYGEEDKIFKTTSTQLQAGLTALVGCNGTGKTTFIHMINDTCKALNIPIFQYSNQKHTDTHALEKYMFENNFKMLALSVQSSEGENVIIKLTDTVNNIIEFVRENKNKPQIVITLDAVDSGLSIDNILLIKKLFYRLINNCTNENCTAYIIVAANAYETANGENCLDIYNGTYRTFKDYDDYKEFIIASEAIKRKRYKS